MQIKIELRSFKSGELINEKKEGPNRGFGYLGKMEPKRNTVILKLSTRYNEVQLYSIIQAVSII